MNVIIIQTVDDESGGMFRAMGGHQLAWYLRRSGYTVQVVNYVQSVFTLDHLNQLLEHFITDETKVIGLGGILLENNDRFFSVVKTAFEQIKIKYPNLNLLGGGTSAGIFKKKFNKAIDYYFEGHAENTMLQFCDWIFKGGQRPIIEIDGNGLKTIKEIAYSGFENFSIEECNFRWHDNDAIQPFEALPLETSRGCIFKCKFCQYPLIGKHKKDFLKPIVNIKNELIDNYERFGTTGYYVLDDTFNADAERLEEFANMVATLPFKIKYATYLRLDLIEAHRHTEDLLLESGLYGAFFGVESFNKTAANLIGKAFNGKKAKDYLPYLLKDKWQGRVKEHLGFIAGVPPETFAELQETNRWCMQNKIVSWRFNALYLNKPGVSPFSSEFERNAEKYGFTLNEPNKGLVKNHWTHTLGTTFQDALNWTNTLNRDLMPYVKKGGWNAVQALQFGYSSEEIDKTSLLDYRNYFDTDKTENSKKDWDDRVREFAENYYRSLMLL